MADISKYVTEGIIEANFLCYDKRVLWKEENAYSTSCLIVFDSNMFSNIHILDLMNA